MNKTLVINGAEVTLESLEQKAGSVHFSYNGKAYAFRSTRAEDGSFVLEEELTPGVWQRDSGGAWKSGKETRTVQVGGLEARITETLAANTGPAAGALSPLAPMPGLVRQVLVKKGDKVAKGQTLVVIEAMKLQLALPAGGDGVVEAVLVKEGELVAEGAELVTLKGSA